MKRLSITLFVLLACALAYAPTLRRWHIINQTTIAGNTATNLNTTINVYKDRSLPLWVSCQATCNFTAVFDVPVYWSNSPPAWTTNWVTDTPTIGGGLGFTWLVTNGTATVVMPFTNVPNSAFVGVYQIRLRYITNHSGNALIITNIVTSVYP